MVMTKNKSDQIFRVYYDECTKEASKILGQLRHKYPKMNLCFYGKNLLDFLGYDNKMFNPSRIKVVSQKKYKDLTKSLLKFNNKSFIKRLLDGQKEF